MVMVRKNSLPVAETNSMDRDEIEQQLQQLALEIKQYPPTNAKNKLQRRKILTRFHNLVMRSGILEVCKKRLRGKYLEKSSNNQLFEDCYEEASQKVWLYVNDKISEYNPQRSSILNWFFNKILEYRFIDTKNERLKIRKVQRNGKRNVLVDESLDKQINVNQSSIGNNLNTRQDIIKSPDREYNRLNFMQEFKQLILQDPWLAFSGKHIKNNPSVNYQEIAIHKLKETSWDEIATRFNLSVGTITPFFSRNHLFFKPFIYEYLQGEFKLSEKNQKLIVEDRKDKLKRIQMKDYPEINFYSIMLDKINGKSWQTMATKWESGMEIRSVIYFYLKTIKRHDQVFQDEFNLNFSDLI